MIVHGTNNSFPGWKEFNLMCGLVGWQGRNGKDGPYVYLKDDVIVRDFTPGKHEPVMFTIQYHEGRVFHSVLGHMAEGSETDMYGKGFRTFLFRGTEWAATGNVTQAPITEI